MSNRQNWKFQYSANDVGNAAQEKALYHRGREEWWKREAEKADKAIRESGVEIREQPVSGGVRHEAVIDPTLSTRLNECRNKMENHKAQAVQYEAFAFALVGKNARIELDVDDVNYFGLASKSDTP